MSKSDPTSSLWISEKYEKDLKAHLESYQAGIIAIYKKYPGDITRIKAEIDKLKAEMIEAQVRPTVTKYLDMSVSQGRKFADKRLKGMKKSG